MSDTVVGRKKELTILDTAFESKKAEFMVVYGRRRIGKTYLVHTFFKKKSCLLFEVTGLKDGNTKDQLNIFTQSISSAFYRSASLTTPCNWMKALQLLDEQIEALPKNKRIVLFFDELPWLATPKSGMLQALDHYWNTKWTYKNKLLLIVCGSAASWMLNKLVHAKGGLHNRITAKIHLMPFSLAETKAFLEYQSVHLNEEQILQIYMAVGGVPHYLHHIKRGMSAAQAINQLCFNKDGLLMNEFETLYKSLFDHADVHLEIMRVLGTSRRGLSKEEILPQLKLSSAGGRFKERINELVEAGFIEGLTPYGRVQRGTYYRIIDEYSLFYLTWIEPAKRKLLAGKGVSHYWEQQSQSQTFSVWAGYAFEAVCYKHLTQIMSALKIGAIVEGVGSWRHIANRSLSPEDKGAQIDLLFDRSDGVLTVCEIKYYNKPFKVDPTIAAGLLRKAKIFQDKMHSHKQLEIVLITVHGMKIAKECEHFISHSLKLIDVF